MGNMLFGLVTIFIWLAVIIGWVANIVQIFALVNLPITSLFIFKCAGIFFFPLGAVLGLIG